MLSDCDTRKSQVHNAQIKKPQQSKAIQTKLRFDGIFCTSKSGMPVPLSLLFGICDLVKLTGWDRCCRPISLHYHNYHFPIYVSAYKMLVCVTETYNGLLGRLGSTYHCFSNWCSVVTLSHETIKVHLHGKCYSATISQNQTNELISMPEFRLSVRDTTIHLLIIAMTF